MADHRLKSTGGEGERTRCVLLAAGGEQPPERLLMLLDQPNTHTVSVAHPLLAAAELASLERERRSRQAWKLDSDERVVLVVVNRETWGDLSPLIRTVQIQMPNVSIWVCTERVAIEVFAGNEALPIDPPVEIPNEPGDQEAMDDPTPGDDPVPGDDPTPGDDPVAGDTDTGPPPTDVTEDEIRFLLELYDADSDDDTDEPRDPEVNP
ncbi:MAG: hypothetical protein MK085_11950 [Phycisphaerales bacterium]|nr:hypothetical protein [Phycisphaerales bacterium]